MNKVEKIVNTVYITGGLVLLTVVIMALSSCGINRGLTNEQIKHRNSIEEWLKDNCKDSYKMPSDMTLDGIPVLFVNKEDYLFCCANWDIFTRKDVKPKGSLGVDANGNIVAY